MARATGKFARDKPIGVARMSDSNTPTPDPPPLPHPSSGPQPPPRDGCLTALMVVIGIFLLLPGLCAVVIGVTTLPGGPGHDKSGLYDLVLICVLIGLALGLGGILLIRAAIRGRRH